jgi:hypothetical protein
MSPKLVFSAKSTQLMEHHKEPYNTALVLGLVNKVCRAASKVVSSPDPALRDGKSRIWYTSRLLGAHRMHVIVMTTHHFGMATHQCLMCTRVFSSLRAGSGNETTIARHTCTHRTTTVTLAQYMRRGLILGEPE